MQCVLTPRLSRFNFSAAAALSILTACLLPGTSFAQSAPPKNKSAHAEPSQVSATYQIALNGFNVGSFRYVSEVGGGAYKLTSDVQLSLLLGAFQWKGVSNTSGTSASTTPAPASFDFDYSSTLKTGSLHMGFAKGSVQSIAINPPAPVAADTVPLKPEHLANVLDPLSAILALTQDSGGKPCDRKLAIFDGKQRFDLQLIYRRDEPVEGTTEMASVCRVKYMPIAGFRQTEETANLARTTGIEISFRSVPNAHLFVPQKIVLPTLAGTAEITVQHVDIKTAGTGQLALISDE